MMRTSSTLCAWLIMCLVGLGVTFLVFPLRGQVLGDNLTRSGGDETSALLAQLEALTREVADLKLQLGGSPGALGRAAQPFLIEPAGTGRDTFVTPSAGGAQQQFDKPVTKAPFVRAGNSSALVNRINVIEASLVRLTAQIEELDLRVTRLASDATAKISDLEFRVCELVKECDLADLPQGGLLGQRDTVIDVTVQQDRQQTSDGEQSDSSASLALDDDERADFNRAQKHLDEGDYRVAADLFIRFTQSYPGSSFVQKAHFGRGEALSNIGDIKAATRAYLEAFSQNPDGPLASKSLLKLGAGLAELGQKTEACITLSEVSTRFPRSVEVIQAIEAKQEIACP